MQNQKDALFGLGYLAQSILGQPAQIFQNANSWLDGLQCSPVSPAALQISIGIGSIYSIGSMDATPYGVLGVDTNQVIKQGILFQPVTLNITPPATSGYSQYYLIQAIYNDVDSGATVLPYWNSQNQQIPWGGPGNSGQQQFTVRQGVCAISLKPGVAAPTGTQGIPPADAGYTPMWNVLVSNGQTTITSTNIVKSANSTFIAPKLTQVPPAIQAQADNFAIDTSTSLSPNAMAISLPSWTSVVQGLTLRIIKSAYKNTSIPTLSINGGTPISIAWADGNALAAGDWPAGAVGQVTFNGTSWELYTIAGPSIFARVAPGTSPSVSDASLLHYGIDTGTSNAAVCASVSPTISTVVSAGITVEVQKTGSANTGSMSFALTAVGGTVTAPLYWADGNTLQANDWPASSLAVIVFDGTYYRLLSVTNRPLIFPQGAYVHYGVASGTNTLTLISTPAFTAPADGIFLEMTPSTNNTGPVTLAANGLSPASVLTVSGGNLAAGQLVSGAPVLLMMLGGTWRLLSGGGGITNVQVLTTSGTYIPSPGTQRALVFATGGGGAGGSGGAMAGGCGGESGTTALSLIQIAGVVSYTIGAGGAPAPSNSASGTQAGSGGQTSFGSLAIAPGGQGGYNNVAAQGPFSGGTTGGTGTFIIASSPGGPPYLTLDVQGTAAGDVNGLGGVGGSSIWGGGGLNEVCIWLGGSNYQFLNASPATGWGSGGGGTWGPIPGAPAPTQGGAGKQGVILVLEF